MEEVKFTAGEGEVGGLVGVQNPTPEGEDKKEGEEVAEEEAQEETAA